VTQVAALLANPSAGRGRAARLVEPTRAALHSAGLEVLLLVGRSAAESVALTRAAVADGIAAVVAVGGDGLVHWVVQALAGTGVPLAIVPAGTGNDFATVLGGPRDLSSLAAAVAAGRSAEIDAGLALPDEPPGRSDLSAAGALPDEPPGRPDLSAAGEASAPAPGGSGERWWTGVLCAGFDSAVNERANRMRWPRGPRRYDLAVFAELSALRPRRLVLTVDGDRQEHEVTLVAVGNGPQYGGGMRICPDARMDDGLFDVVVVGPLRRSELVRLKPLLRTGRHVRHPSVQVIRARRVRLESPDVVAYADGERLALLPVSLSCIPSALRVVVP
jgi:diacylglycerol kinase (ATP)